MLREVCNFADRFPANRSTRCIKNKQKLTHIFAGRAPRNRPFADCVVTIAAEFWRNENKAGAELSHHVNCFQGCTRAKKTSVLMKDF
jgi:hypothetical protein